MKRNLAIFDLDGTLLNTIEDLAAGVNAALEMNSLPLHPTEDYYQMVGNGVRNLVRRALPEVTGDNVLEKVLSDFYTCYRASIDRFTKPYPGMEDLLDRLQREGCLIAVASNKFQDGVSALTKRFFPGISFTSVLGNRPGAPLKPSPLIIKEIVRGCKEEEEEELNAVMVGDTGIDIATAKAAGIPAIAVSWGFRSREELADADTVADTPEQLYDALAKYFD